MNLTYTMLSSVILFCFVPGYAMEETNISRLNPLPTTIYEHNKYYENSANSIYLCSSKMEKFSDKDTVAIASYIKNKTGTQSFTLRYGEFTNEGFKNITDAIKLLPELHKIQFFFVDVSENRLADILSIIREKKIRQLLIWYCDLDSDIEQIKKIIRDKTNLTELTLWRNGLTPYQVSEIKNAQNLYNRQLKLIVADQITSEESEMLDLQEAVDLSAAIQVSTTDDEQKRIQNYYDSIIASDKSFDGESDFSEVDKSTKYLKNDEFFDGEYESFDEDEFFDGESDLSESDG